MQVFLEPEEYLSFLLSSGEETNTKTISCENMSGVVFNDGKVNLSHGNWEFSDSLCTMRYSYFFGSLHGKQKCFIKSIDGQIMRTVQAYYLGVLHGISKPRKYHEVVYCFGKKVKERGFYKDGKKRYSNNYSGQLLDGVEKLWNFNGKLIQKTRYSRGKIINREYFS